MRSRDLQVICVMAMMVATGLGVSAQAAGTRKHQTETVLVAMEKGGFKSEVAEKIRAAMETRGVSVTINDYGTLDPDKVGEYHAVVIISDIKAGKPAGKVTGFLRKLAERDKEAITLVAVEKKGEWQTNYHGVEVMTAAPRDAMVEALANKVISKLDASIEAERDQEDQENQREKERPAPRQGQ